MSQIEKCPFVENKEKECDVPRKAVLNNVLV